MVTSSLDLQNTHNIPIHHKQALQTANVCVSNSRYHDVEEHLPVHMEVYAFHPLHSLSHQSSDGFKLSDDNLTAPHWPH